MPESGTGYPVESWYSATANPAPLFPPLDGDTQADVVIVGGGYTGLSAALHLAEAGIDTVLVEAHRVGWGASGRNGGQVHSGQRRDMDWLENRLGLDDARKLWDLGEEAKGLVQHLITRHAIDCDWRPGLFDVVHKSRLVARERAYVEKLKASYGYDKVEWYDRDRLARALGTPVYHGGWRDGGGGHLHPLNFALGIAQAAAQAGARIHEKTAAVALSESGSTSVRTERGSIRADTVVLAGNGYLDRIDAGTDARVMPINNFILTTEPVGAGRAGGIMPGGEGASDSRFVVHYWRPTPDGRILFGGGETYRRRFPSDIGSFVRRHFVNLYPQLAGARIDHAWGGTLAVTVNRLPLIRRLRPGVYVAAGYSGQGVALAPFAGKVLAEAISGDTGRFDTFAALPCPPFPGGRLLRAPTLAAAMTWFALRDRI